ncbi:GGDEF domain-containing protein [Xanthobacter agilis]|jgi:diguanylate cyclase|uniref:Diguanylate cyclase DosC n=1 Tax=Xanthobacter agilis TaxID=47492 RepID=A0ABU0L7Y4_XANAG|nr:GGDEF domain-containing protein [Xanthobacter agilis]MDQ0503255.1 diguanylate cyclase [Xanthobacter agilis]
MQSHNVGTPIASSHALPQASKDTLAVLDHLIGTHAQRLVRRFYDAFLEDADGAAFLSHQMVETRLVHSLRQWLIDLFVSADTEAQRKIGEVHARIKLPFGLVIKGAALLKAEMSDLLIKSELDRAALASTLVFVDARMDWAMGLMSEAYMQGSMRRAQVDEAFRLFAVGQDVSLTRETQNAALMEWLQSILFPLLEGTSNADLVPLAKSTFGLWFHHRAGLIFQGAPGLEVIHSNLKQIDTIVLPKLQESRPTNGEEMRKLLARLRELVEEIKFVLSDLFQSIAGVEGGRDPLTRALNRRFLPTILGREVSIASSTGTPFTILMIDVDHFKQINDRWGHSTGDMVLQQVADVVMDTVRFNDFVFRYGGEEFLIALVEAGVNEGYEIAERVRARLAERRLRLSDGNHVQVTASVGVASYSGHPDYVQLVDAADRALYEAKHSGRNRTVVSQEAFAGTP